MSYSSLMVHVDVQQPSTAAWRIAADLARAFGARLIGITACEESQSPYFAAGAYAESAILRAREQLLKLMVDAEASFRSAVKEQVGAPGAHGAPGARGAPEWRSALDLPTSYVAREARAADLLVALSRGDALLADPVKTLDPSTLVMQAGRPVLLVPPQAQQLALDSVVVAWKDSREARRAVRDALPLLKRAKQVRVVEIVNGPRDMEAAERRLADVAIWLGRHGVTATTLVPPPRGTLFAQIDAASADAKADLIVAGAYGHSRLGEWVFGGVTHHLLTTATCCLLLSH